MPQCECGKWMKTSIPYPMGYTKYLCECGKYHFYHCSGHNNQTNFSLKRIAVMENQIDDGQAEAIYQAKKMVMSAMDVLRNAGIDRGEHPLMRLLDFTSGEFSSYLENIRHKKNA